MLPPRKRNTIKAIVWMTGEGWGWKQEDPGGQGRWANVNEKDRWDIGVERKMRTASQVSFLNFWVEYYPLYLEEGQAVDGV